MAVLINFVLGAWIVFCAISAIAWVAALLIKLEMAYNAAHERRRPQPKPRQVSPRAYQLGRWLGQRLALKSSR